ncbi:restriction endonuclease [Halorubrum sp. SD690R]|uniref:restriction endonuclease n=1 Tax=Halorubrum sp. SD690R TaxID=2518117 RepID=UPI0010F8B897|nr:restriction endonuclease [Halorubrum sp. SD690R]TKX47282.1 restriction endonuclease [Halorubrum sp. SD690R]
MAILDDLSGFEFEDLIEDVFRNLGYENVRQAEKTADEGRDVLMEEVIDGTRRAIVVECKHTGTVGRPVVQKLHSAIATFDFDGPKRGMVVTTGRFTDPAQEYTNRLQQNDDPHPIELLDGEALREIADEIGLDLYNGRIEILCDETLRPYDPATDVDAPVKERFRDIENIEAADPPEPHSTVTFRPVVAVTADTNAVFETSVGVIHRINDRTQFVVHADRGHPKVADDDVATLVIENFHAAVPLDIGQLTEVFDDVEERRFGQTQTEYKEWAVDRLQDYHTTTVTYTGDNNVTYNKTCKPNLSDISVQSIEPVYLPEVRQTTELQEYSYPYEYYAAGPSRVTLEDGIHRCVHCETSGIDETYTYCPNCGAIACRSHIETERVEGEPVCTGCAVTERFALKPKYFYGEQNLETFREEYAEMPLHEKAMENPLLAGGSVVAALLLIIGLLVIGGVI